MHSLNHYCEQKLHDADAAQLRRVLRVSECSAVEIIQDGANYISFAGNDYLGLRTHPAVIAAGQAALAKYGAGAGASRLVTGNHPLYAPLEAKLAALKHTEAALVFGSGYLANIGAITALMGESDLILADKLAHACILDGAKLSGAALKRFAHNDAAHAAALLKQHRADYRHALIVTEHIFSMDGDRAPLPELSALAHRHDTWLMVDDAHGFFVPPPLGGRLGGGRHMAMSEQVSPPPNLPPNGGGVPDIWMGTLSKAVGAYGGYVAAAQPVIDYLVNHARSFIFSTGLPPAVCASALAALEIIEAEPARRARPLALATRVTSALKLPDAQSAIVPIIVGDAAAALDLSEHLKRHGILATAIRPPTVPPNTSRIRLTFSAEHSDAHVERLIAALKEVI